MTELHLISWNRPKMTELAVKTIARNTPRSEYKLVVLDNASDESVVDMLQDLTDKGLVDTLIALKTNVGLEAARDVLIRETETKRFVDVDNDCLPPKGWLKGLNDLMDKHHEFAAISLRTQVMIGTGNIFENEKGPLTEFPHPGGSFRLMNTTVVSRLGGWDRKSPGRGSEEKYICNKLWNAGYKCAFATDIECLHLFGTRGENETDRWGYPIHFKPEDSGHSDVWHPVLGQGDDYEQVKKYAGKKLADAYFGN